MSFSPVAFGLLQGVLIGLSIAVPVGPSSILCIQRSLRSGAAAGLATGLGIATVHAVYAALAVQGSREVADFADAHAGVLRLASVALLLLFAVRALTSVPSGMGQALRDVPARQRRMQWSRAYGSAVLLGATNPMTILFFLAAVSALATIDADPRRAEIAVCLVLGVSLGSMAWWSVLVVAVRLASRSLMNDRSIRWVNRASALSLAVVGLALLLPEIRSRIETLPVPAAELRGGRTCEGACPPPADRRQGAVALR